MTWFQQVRIINEILGLSIDVNLDPLSNSSQHHQVFPFSWYTYPLEKAGGILIKYIYIYIYIYIYFFFFFFFTGT